MDRDSSCFNEFGVFPNTDLKMKTRLSAKEKKMLEGIEGSRKQIYDIMKHNNLNQLIEKRYGNEGYNYPTSIFLWIIVIGSVISVLKGVITNSLISIFGGGILFGMFILLGMVSE